jgi:hypothetical protein
MFIKWNFPTIVKRIFMDSRDFQVKEEKVNKWIITIRYKDFYYPSTIESELWNTVTIKIDKEPEEYLNELKEKFGILHTGPDGRQMKTKYELVYSEKVESTFSNGEAAFIFFVIILYIIFITKFLSV